ncbi:MAG: CHAD domain-containing protein [Undibacterium sp.]|uniref:CHAD domain-containing protein n=1 Tax=Undibacterium sp. TaxID=1914977 RepID=UPI00272751F6|nr:CHAD domain-containing protein [Undibacterium sp.]MDO8653965.1 CHAD domain-containing protein [Undibacterium sp.]
MEQLKLSKRMNIEQTFQAIVFNCIEQIQSNEAGITKEYDAESLHQMRVGLRRLHSALDLFKNILRLPDTLQQELDWLTTQLSTARDWDVLTTSTLPSLIETLAETDNDKNEMAELLLTAMSKTYEKHKTAAAAVRSQRYASLIRILTNWTRHCGWRDAMSIQMQYCLQIKTTKFARNAIALSQHNLLKRGKKLRTGSPQARHRVRIAAKKMRYATEFFYSLGSVKRVQSFLTILSRFQDELGRLNDAAVAKHLLKELVSEHAQLASSINSIRQYLTSEVSTDDKKIRHLWRKIALTKHPF